MTADEYLGQYRLIEAEIKQREKLINRMRREIFSGPTDNVIANIDGAIRGGNSNYWDDRSLKQYKDELGKQEEKVKAYRKFQMDVIKQIDSMESRIDRVILYSKYIDGLTWEEVAKETGYSFGYARGYLKSVALNHFFIKYNKQFYKINSK